MAKDYYHIINKLIFILHLVGGLILICVSGGILLDVLLDQGGAIAEFISMFIMLPLMILFPVFFPVFVLFSLYGMVVGSPNARKLIVIWYTGALLSIAPVISSISTIVILEGIAGVAILVFLCVFGFPMLKRLSNQV
jgi:hypothetical protein